MSIWWANGLQAFLHNKNQWCANATGISVDMALDLNICHCTMKLNHDASKIYTPVLPWSRYSYKNLPLGRAASSNIVQIKTFNVRNMLEYIQVYVGNLWVVNTDSFNNSLAWISAGESAIRWLYGHCNER